VKLSDTPVETIVDDTHAAKAADVRDVVHVLRPYAPWCDGWDLAVIGRADNPDDPSNDGHLNMSFMSLAMVARLTVPPSYVAVEPIRNVAHELAHLAMSEFDDWAANLIHTLETCTEANASIAADFFHDVEERTCWRIADGIVAGHAATYAMGVRVADAWIASVDPDPVPDTGLFERFVVVDDDDDRPGLLENLVVVDE
jgi:hypothetical protein